MTFHFGEYKDYTYDRLSGQFLTAVLVFLLHLVFTMCLNNADNEDTDKQNTNQPILLDIIQSGANPPSVVLICDQTVMTF
jgi:hypothetical protein